MNYKKKIYMSLLSVSILSLLNDSHQIYANEIDQPMAVGNSNNQNVMEPPVYIEVNTEESLAKLIQNDLKNTFIHIPKSLLENSMDIITDEKNNEISDILLNYYRNYLSENNENYGEILISYHTSLGTTIISEKEKIETILNKINTEEIKKEAEETDNIKESEEVNEIIKDSKEYIIDEKQTNDVIDGRKTEEQKETTEKPKVKDNSEVPNEEEVKRKEESQTESEKQVTQKSPKKTDSSEDANKNDTTSEEINIETSRDDQKRSQKSEIKTSEIKEPITTMNFSASTTSNLDETYTVQSGDTLYKIARIFDVSVDNIVNWNNLTNPNQIYVGQKLIIKQKETYNPDPNNELIERERPFNSNQEFVDYVSKQAEIVAPQNGLYASVMIAQAILETGYGQSALSMPPYYNLFGIKTTSDDPNHVYTITSEQDKEGNEYRIYDYFKTYNNYADSFRDNAKKLKTGTMYNQNFYAGAWVENTDGYKEATNWLQGRYATDVKYAEKLNRIIQQYDLTQYDSFNKIINNHEVAYNGTIKKSADIQVYDIPPIHSNYEVLTNTNALDGDRIIIREIVETKNKTFYLIEQDGRLTGWINADYVELHSERILSNIPVTYKAIIVKPNYGIFTVPAYTDGNIKTRHSSSMLSESVEVMREIQTEKRTWVLLEKDDIKLGWINKDALNFDHVVTEKYTVAYNTQVKAETIVYPEPILDLDSEPEKFPEELVGEPLIVRQEALTNHNERWLLVEHNKLKIGWVNAQDAQSTYDVVINEKNVAYKAILNSNQRYQIFNKPAYTNGSFQVADADDFEGKEIVARSKAITKDNRSWILIEADGEILGWINENALLPDYDRVISRKNSAYNVTLLTEGRYQIFNRPAYTMSSYQVADSSNYTNQKFVVREEVNTKEGRVWVLLEHNGEIIGWVNKKATKNNFDSIVTEHTVAYNATIKTNGRYQLFNRPAYTTDSYQIAESSDYTGEQIVVRGEVRTKNGRIWVLIERNKDALGWINKNAIDPSYDSITTSKKVSYNAKISTLGRYQVFNKPAYTNGSYQVADSSKYTGKIVTVLQEIRTQANRTWVLIEVNGKEVGWINKNALNR